MLKLRPLDGAVAQLGERRVRNAKVEGSIPFRSTNYIRHLHSSLLSTPGPGEDGDPRVGCVCARLSRLTMRYGCHLGQSEEGFSG